MRQKIIVDIDDTITIVGARKAYLSVIPPNYEKFHEQCYQDKPRKYIIDLVKVMSKKYDIVFFTMRPESKRMATEEWLKEYVGVDYQLIMRKDGDKLAAPYEKQVMLAKNDIFPDDVICIIEDSEDVINNLRGAGYNCVLVCNSKIKSV